jgi:hypothetical protein
MKGICDEALKSVKGGAFSPDLEKTRLKPRVPLC